MKPSQHGIEEYLDHLFYAPGHFLEIGCWHGEQLSQTAYLEKEKRWTGVCVDPFPVGFENRTCRVCRNAISGDGKNREFIKVSIDRRNGGDVSYFSGFSDSIGRHREVIEQFCDHEIVIVPTITIEQLYKQYDLPAYIDFLSVDTEGSELEILSSIDLSRCRFGAIMFEHNEDEGVRRAIGDLLTLRGYLLFKSWQCDDLYIDEHV